MMLTDFTSSNTATLADVYENAKDEFESENVLKMLEYNQALNTYITSKSELLELANNKDLMEYLHQTAKDTSWAGTRASALLNFFAGNNYYHKPVLKEPLFTQKTSKKQTQSENLTLPDDGLEVKVYPNPASSWLSFEYELNPEANAQIEIFDMDGRLVQNITLQQQAKQVILDIRNWKQGTYLYRIVSGEGKLNSGKFMVVK